MKFDKPVIAFDADEVVIECRDYLLQSARQAYPERNIQVVEQNYDLDKRFNIPKADIKKIWEVWAKNLHEQQPFEGIGGVLTALRKKDCHIVVVTAIDHALMNSRLACFKKHGLEFDQVITTGFHGDKREALTKLRPILFFDDRLKNLKSAQGLNIHRVWIEHAGEIQELPDHPSLYEEKHSSVANWFKATSFLNKI